MGVFLSDVSSENTWKWTGIIEMILTRSRLSYTFFEITSPSQLNFHRETSVVLLTSFSIIFSLSNELPLQLFHLHSGVFSMENLLKISPGITN